MGKKRIPLLTKEQVKELNHLYTTDGSHKVRQNAHIILLKSQGHSSEYITTLSGYPKHAVTINTWLNRYESSGIAGLKNKAGQGRKKILNKATDETIVKDIVKSERQRLTYAKSLIEKELDVQMSKRTLTRFLKRLTGVTAE
jgi:transposase